MEDTRIRWRDVAITSQTFQPDQIGLEQCQSCPEKAEIFQVTGDYCLNCWQEETYPDV